jgi:hypothetical protein
VRGHKTEQQLGAVLGRYAELEGGEPWFYLSFADPKLPEGEQFLGGAYVRGVNEGAAVGRSHKLGINPGGEVMTFGPLADEAMAENVPEPQRERLLTREEVSS